MLLHPLAFEASRANSTTGKSRPQRGQHRSETAGRDVLGRDLLTGAGWLGVLLVTTTPVPPWAELDSERPNAAPPLAFAAHGDAVDAGDQRAMSFAVAGAAVVTDPGSALEGQHTCFCSAGPMRPASSLASHADQGTRWHRLDADLSTRRAALAHAASARVHHGSTSAKTRGVTPATRRPAEPAVLRGFLHPLCPPGSAVHTAEHDS